MGLIGFLFSFYDLHHIIFSLSKPWYITVRSHWFETFSLTNNHSNSFQVQIYLMMIKHTSASLMLLFLFIKFQLHLMRRFFTRHHIISAENIHTFLSNFHLMQHVNLSVHRQNEIGCHSPDLLGEVWNYFSSSGIKSVHGSEETQDKSRTSSFLSAVAPLYREANYYFMLIIIILHPEKVCCILDYFRRSMNEDKDRKLWATSSFLQSKIV